jgi:hypothetical protein
MKSHKDRTLNKRTELFQNAATGTHLARGILNARAQMQSRQRTVELIAQANYLE